MGDASEDAEILAVFLEELQVGGGDVVASLACGEKLIAEQPEVVANGEHPAGFGAGSKRR
jgi:hypothetical protein